MIASVNGLPYLGACLDALERHARNCEVVVADCTDDATRAYVSRRWPNVQLLSFDGVKTVPELRAAGIFATAAPHVAVIEDHCNVTANWAESLLAAHTAGRDVVGGPVRNVMTRRVRDWAAFLCEYSSFIEPARGGAVGDLPGMNVSYGRRALAEIDDLLREGRWESWLHRRLRDRGFELHCVPDAVIEHAKDFGFREFLSQRFHYSRSYAAMRSPELGGRRALYALGSPLLVPLMIGRISRNVARRPPHWLPFVRALPLIALYATVWAVGEAIGYVAGGGDSLRRVR